MPFVSKEAAAYPSELNMKIGAWLVTSSRPSLPIPVQPLHVPETSALVRVGRFSNVLVKPSAVRASVQAGREQHSQQTGQLRNTEVGQPTFTARLSLDTSSRQVDSTLGGLRRAFCAVQKMHKASQVGSKIRQAFISWMEAEPGVIDEVLQHLGAEGTTALAPHLASRANSIIREVLQELGQELKVFGDAPLASLDVGLLESWRLASMDPDDQPTRWLVEGAPAGLTSDIVDRGVFPLHDPLADAPEVAAADLQTELQFANYPGVEDSQAVADELARLHGCGFVEKFSSLREAEGFVGGEVVLSKIAVIDKIRNGKRKTRIVVDSKRSLVSRATRRYERAILPRVTDTVDDQLQLLDLAREGEELEFMVADFKDAFFILPLRPEERRFFVVQHRGRYYVFTRSTQGSRCAPLTWARLAALVARLTQATLGHKARLSIYVDDPLLSCVGTQHERNMCKALTLLLWGAIKLPLSLAKASAGQSLTWTSAVYAVMAHPGTKDVGIMVEVKPSLLADVRSVTHEMLGLNIVSLKKLRSFTGQLMHIASLVQVLRPFITDLYGALYGRDDGPTRAPKGCVWVKQVRHVLTWVAAWLEGTPGALQKLYPLKRYRMSADRISLHLDASPWGLGAYLAYDGVAVAWFASRLGDEELRLLDLQRGEASAQQAVEALCALVAIRQWQSRWRDAKWSLRLRSDSVSALVLAMKLKTHGAACGIIARELALDMAVESFPPVIAEHVPGIANLVPDILSRRYDPHYEKDWQVPPLLRGVHEVVLAPRGLEYYRSLRGPPAAAAAGAGNPNPATPA